MITVWILILIYLLVGLYLAVVTMSELLSIHDNSKWWQTILFVILGGTYIVLLWPLFWRRM